MKIEHLCFSFDQKALFDDFNLEIQEGTITALMAPSGKGKSTLLRLIAGLLKPDSGTINLEGQSVGIMFQEPRLFSQLTALQNVELVIKDKQNKRDVALRLLTDFDLADAAHKYPDELSGGMAKRVSLARVIAFDAQILLLDEPFSALDKDTKYGIMSKTKQLLSGKTVLLVTHDLQEASFFADQIINMF